MKGTITGHVTHVGQTRQVTDTFKVRKFILEVADGNYTQTVAPGFAVFMYPSSVQGHVWGALQRCDQNAIQPADNGQGYIWI